MSTPAPLPPESPQPVVGPDPVDLTPSATSTPANAAGRTPPTDLVSVSAGTSPTPTASTHEYDVFPDPSVIAYPVTTRPAVDHGYNVAERTVGSERLYLTLAYGFELLKGILVLMLLGILTHLFVATIFRISGESMLPNFVDGQFILVDRLSYLIHEPLRGDVVVIKFPGDPEHRKFIKRVIGLPGETVAVKDGHYIINGRVLREPYLPAGLETSPDLERVLRADEYFVSGDNRPNSNDSRFFGPVPFDEFIGKSQAILSGKAFGWVAQPAF